MKFIIKQKIFSFADSFVVKDEYDNPLLKVQGKYFSLAKKLKIFDMQDNEIYYIEQKLFKFLPEYRIFQGSQQIAFLKKEFTFMKPKINIKSIYGNFTIDGKILQYNFTIHKEEEPVAIIDKKLMSFSDTYAVDVSDDEDIPFIVTLVIVIDQMLHDDRSNR